MRSVQPVRQNPYPQVRIRRLSRLSAMVRCGPLSLRETVRNPAALRIVPLTGTLLRYIRAVKASAVTSGRSQGHGILRYGDEARPKWVSAGGRWPPLYLSPGDSDLRKVRTGTGSDLG